MKNVKHWFAWTGKFLVPFDAAAERYVNKLEPGEGLVMSVKKVRSIYWHNMYFACCREIGHNCDPERSEASIDPELRVRAGHFDVLFVAGHEVHVPKRIAFDEMDAHEWAALWPSLDLAMQEGFGFDFQAWKRHAA